MSVVWRRTVPLYLTLILALIIIGRSFIIDPTVKGAASQVLKWASLVRAISVGIGFVSILVFHVPKIKDLANEPVPYQWVYSLTAVVSMLIFAVVGVTLGVRSSEYLWLYNTWYRPVAGLSTAVSSFFVLSAMYRSFRVRNIEALALVGPALLILLYEAPIGTFLLPGMGPVADYIFRYISSAAFRGFIAAAAFGTMILSLRTIIGRERGYLPEEA